MSQTSKQRAESAEVSKFGGEELAAGSLSGTRGQKYIDPNQGKTTRKALQSMSLIRSANLHKAIHRCSLIFHE